MLDADYWTQRYQDGRTGWDLGQVSPPLKAYVDQLNNIDLRILIPGAGNAYEAEYLLQQGFTNVTVIDISEAAIQNVSQRLVSFDPQHWQALLQDFFEHDGQYDLIIEQTFFCAIDPKLRNAYVEKMQRLLAPKGHLMGVLFNIPLYTDHPPFGGSEQAYKPLFEPYFHFHTWAECYNSIGPRQGNEWFINLTPK